VIVLKALPRLVLLPALGALALAGCGSSSNSASIPAASAPSSVTITTTRVPTTATTASTPASTASSSGGIGGCQPTSSGGAPVVPCPKKLLSASHNYTVKLDTNYGKIDMSLATSAAPIAAANFAYLVKRGFYNGLTFNRIVPGFVIQGGAPIVDGQEAGPGYQLVEAPPSYLQYNPGVVAMAKTAVAPYGDAQSQFFICVADTNLPPQYAYVGNVTKGLNVAVHISDLPNSGGALNQPEEPVIIRRATLVAG
jgi:cyclophilin family peptidyl-prolyl cis-trans isomerase